MLDPASLALALVAGAVAAFNPCGFALLPAYLTLLVSDPDGDRSRGAAAVRAVRFTTGMTTGFVAVFGAFALVVAPLAISLERWLPVLTVVIGAVLVVLGVWLLTGRTLAVPGLDRRGRAPRATWSSQIGYGATFALASLSCTLAPFLAVTTSALREGSIVGVGASFVTYALGMGAVVGVLAAAATVTTSTITVRLRRVAPLIARSSGALLVAAGAYVGWYGWFELRVLAGTTVQDPVVSAAIEVQGVLSRAVAGVDARVLLAAALAVLAASAWALKVMRGRRAQAEPEPQDAPR